MSADTDQRIETERPPGFAGLAIGRSADELRARARALATELAQHGAGDVEQLAEHLALVGARFSRFDVRVFGQFPVGDTDPALATMTLAASELNTDDREEVRRNRYATASAMLRQYQQRHPDADARIVQVPSGPAVAAVVAGEFRLPAEQFGEVTRTGGGRATAAAGGVPARDSGRCERDRSRRQYGQRVGLARSGRAGGQDGPEYSIGRGGGTGVTLSAMQPARSSSAVQDHATAAGPVFILVGCFIVGGGIVAFLAFMPRHRFKSPERQAELLVRKFDGRPEVYVGKSHWSLDYGSVRDVARRCGCVEGGTPGYRFHAFRRQW
ncbi:hypothetical protein FHX42_000563 [Saccharopolyspora lacisalsi]|uniref:Uncharacterized protein n=1 Tax=Halosaccharopolyspora lacisalsi TaxID=1000566 RepID=A0A839DP16_9PSEU|nr:hypothetical protein [Halosaccharopolyspora lacisalsi]MBA8823234.1 hypothetical protein [Halosaccharopolyspora lacisalsi]